jgi:cell division protein FtsW (lipid II flippase)
VLGLILYFVSPLVQYFLNDTRNAIHQRQARFFGIEHITMMLIGIIVITIGSAKSNRKLTDRKKFRTMAVWFTIGLLIILSSVPWPFTSWASRPWFRGF